MTVIAMSRTEIDRMSVLHDLADGRIRIAEASTLMGLGRRQVFRLVETGVDCMKSRFSRASLALGGKPVRKPDCLAGAGGFEPPHGRTPLRSYFTIQ